MKKSGQWWDVSWNPITGCMTISEGCQRCWAKAMVKRFPNLHEWDTFPHLFSRLLFHPKRIEIPLHWHKPKRIFVCSLGDLFHEDVDGFWIGAIFETMRESDWHTFFVLTKRPERILRLTPPLKWPPNVWLGVSVENQIRANERIPIILQIPAAKRFVNLEPLLGPINIQRFLQCKYCRGTDWYGDNGPGMRKNRECIPCDQPHKFIDLVIAGSETGPGARPAEFDWFRSIRDQCQAAGVPFWLKNIDAKGNRVLDGRTWEEYPE